MVSFFDLLEQLENAKSPLMGGEIDSKAAQVVRAGNHLHKENQRSFWDEFVELCANAEGLATLLGVESSKVASWSSKIKEMIRKVDEEDHSSGNNEEETKVLPTGDNGAITMPNDNQDPVMGEL